MRKIFAGILTSIVTIALFTMPANADRIDPSVEDPGLIDLADEKATAITEKADQEWEQTLEGVDRITQEQADAYNKGKADEGNQKNKGPSKSGFDGVINPRNWNGGDIKTNYLTGCFSSWGTYLHGGYCNDDDILIYDAYSDDYAASYTVTAASFSYDKAAQVDGTRVTGSNNVGSASCAPTNSSTSGGITTTNTFRSMAYSFKYIQMKGSGKTGGFTEVHDAYNSASGAYAKYQLEFLSHFTQAKDRTAAWKAAGYKTTSESSATKKKVGCYYNTTMKGKTTAWFGNAKCVVGYNVEVIDNRTGKVVGTKSGKSAYGNAPSITTCRQGLKAAINVEDLIPNDYGRYQYKRTIQYDNPDVIYNAATGGWSLTNVLSNGQSSQPVSIYVRNTCNPDWNGVSSTPYGDTVSKNGSTYNLRYSQQDCSIPGDPNGGDGRFATRCIAPSQGNGTVDVIVDGNAPAYSLDTNTVIDGGKVVIPRNGVDQDLTFSIPNVGVSNEYRDFYQGNLPKDLRVSKSSILKNQDGTPWAKNSEVRNGVQLDSAHKADFVLKRTGADWISKISDDSSAREYTDGVAQYSYHLGDEAVNKATVASRWESEEGKPTVLRSDYNITGQFPYKKYFISALLPNYGGAGAAYNSAIEYSEQTMRCVSGPTEVETVRSVN